MVELNRLAPSTQKSVSRTSRSSSWWIGCMGCGTRFMRSRARTASTTPTPIAITVRPRKSNSQASAGGSEARGSSRLTIRLPSSASFKAPA